MSLRLVHATRYVLPFREGGSVPALVEGDDLGMYVVKLRGAGQGAKALVAELVSGELARAAGLDVPLAAMPRSSSTRTSSGGHLRSGRRPSACAPPSPTRR